MGPIKDTLGVEQGGMSLDSFYKLIDNELLHVSQNSELGAILGYITILYLQYGKLIMLSFSLV